MITDSKHNIKSAINNSNKVMESGIFKESPEEVPEI